MNSSLKEYLRGSEIHPLTTVFGAAQGRTGGLATQGAVPRSKKLCPGEGSLIAHQDDLIPITYLISPPGRPH